MQSYFTYQILRMKKRNYRKQPRFAMHRTLLIMHRTLCEIANKWPVFIMTTIQVPLYLLHLMKSYLCRRTLRFEYECLKYSLKQVGTYFHFMPKLRHYSTVQLAISCFIKDNVPTNWLFLLSLETQWKYVCYHSFLR